MCENHYTMGPYGLLAVMGATMASDTLNPPGPQVTSPQSSIDQGDEMEETMNEGQFLPHDADQLYPTTVAQCTDGPRYPVGRPPPQRATYELSFYHERVSLRPRYPVGRPPPQRATYELSFYHERVSLRGPITIPPRSKLDLLPSSGPVYMMETINERKSFIEHIRPRVQELECLERMQTVLGNRNQQNEDGYLNQLLLLLMMMPAFLQYKKSAVPEEPRQARNRQKLTTESVTGFCRQPQVTWSYPRSALVC